MDIDDLPPVAFDSPGERARVASLFDEYNHSPNLDISPEVDHEFAKIAHERTKRHPLRTYAWVPFGRALTIWFTPRTELLPINGKFWPISANWEDSRRDFLATAGLGALNYLYIALALGGIWVAWHAGSAGGACSHTLEAPQSLGHRTAAGLPAGAHGISDNSGGARTSLRCHLLSCGSCAGRAALGSLASVGRALFTPRPREGCRSRSQFDQRSSTGSGWMVTRATCGKRSFTRSSSAAVTSWICVMGRLPSMAQ